LFWNGQNWQAMDDVEFAIPILTVLEIAQNYKLNDATQQGLFLNRC
jgi:hypothetical protein